MEACADEAHRAHARHLHAVLGRLGLKGHRLGRLPGVAVTVLAILLTRRGADTRARRHAALLGALRDLLRREAPVADLDALEVSRGEGAGRPTAPLRVVAHEIDLASRLTACTTRHLLDAVAHAAALPHADAALGGAAAAARWRDATMLRCARVRPRSAAAVAATLHAALARLDGHPLMDSLHVEEEEAAGGAEGGGEGGALLVRCTLRADADVARYGLREGDALAPPRVAGGRYAIVRRGARAWPLACAAPGRTATPRGGGAAPSVRDLVLVAPGVVVPNAPSLTVDVLSHFGPDAWERDEDALV